MGIIDKIRRKSPVDPDDRRKSLLSHGRITDGIILDSEINTEGQEVVIYLYTLNGVDFESADVLTEEQRQDRIKYAPGAKVAIRYDTKNQGNSILE
ncbi:MAG: hypothetical protein ACKVRN_14405 [Pyrinomonadaceae bacterium]